MFVFGSVNLAWKSNQKLMTSDTFFEYIAHVKNTMYHMGLQMEHRDIE